jgi:hypothetical protein
VALRIAGLHYSDFVGGIGPLFRRTLLVLVLIHPARDSIPVVVKQWRCHTRLSGDGLEKSDLVEILANDKSENSVLFRNSVNARRPNSGLPSTFGHRLHGLAGAMW